MKRTNIAFDEFWKNEKGGLPENVQTTYQLIKSEIVNSADIRSELDANGLSNSKIEHFISQGSQKDKTGNTHFKKTKKHDLDTICVLNDPLEVIDLTECENEDDAEYSEQWNEIINNNLCNYNDVVDEYYYDDVNFAPSLDNIIDLQVSFGKAIKKLFRNKYNVEIGKKAVRLKFSNGDQNYTTEITLGINLEVIIEKEKLDRTIQNKSMVKRLLENNCIVSEDNNYVVYGWMIFGFDKNADEILEIPNFSNINLQAFKETNKNSKGSFAKYVRWFKHFIAVFNEINKNEKIKISSFQIESLLWYLYWNGYSGLFDPNINSQYVLKIAKSLKNVFRNSKDYYCATEMNYILLFSRNMTYEQYIGRIGFLVKAINNELSN